MKNILSSGRIPAFFFAISLVVASPTVWAKSAEMTLIPTRVVLEGNTRYATVTVKNSGDGVGRYRIELIDASMGEEGGVQLREDGSRDPFSALDMISISPRSITLKPDEFQTIRLLVKKKEGIADGEYRSHLKVKMVENDLDAETGKPNAENAAIALKPKLVMVIPVIIRYGETSYKATLEEAKIVEGGGDKPNPQARLVLGFEGTRSLVSDVKITHVGTDGKDTLLKFFPGVAIYRGTARRAINIPLEVPAGVNIRSGKITATLLTQEKEGGKVLAEKVVTP